MSVEPMRRKRVSQGGGGDHGARIATLENKVAAMHTTLTGLSTDMAQAKIDVAAVKDDTATIRDIITHTKSVGGFVAKHGPRVLAFILGGLVLSGRMSAETSQLFKSLFGI